MPGTSTPVHNARPPNMMNVNLFGLAAGALLAALGPGVGSANACNCMGCECRQEPAKACDTEPCDERQQSAKACDPRTGVGCRWEAAGISEPDDSGCGGDRGDRQQQAKVCDIGVDC